MASGKADRYWAQFVRSLASRAARPRTYYEAFRFGCGATEEEASETATSNATLVVAGTKTWVEDRRRVPVSSPIQVASAPDGHRTFDGFQAHANLSEDIAGPDSLLRQNSVAGTETRRTSDEPLVNGRGQRPNA
jgi:hypothetical protein